MITTTETGRVCHVTGDKPQQIEDDLNAAVELIRHEATREGMYGILVTRHAPASFTVAVSAQVPYGVIRESCRIQASVAAAR
jgi:hypothetical protein